MHAGVSCDATAGCTSEGWTSDVDQRVLWRHRCCYLAECQLDTFLACCIQQPCAPAIKGFRLQLQGLQPGPA